jgi:feruloyl esterase
LVAALAAGAAHAASPCEGLTGLKLPHVTVTEARVVTKAPAGPGLPGAPSYCRVLGTARPTSDSDIRFEVAIPEGEAWNGRYLQVGNGGFAGAIPEQSILIGVAQGYAAAGTDDGHEAIGTDAAWGVGHPEKVTDFGYRALKETTDAAKAIVAAYEQRAPRYAYFLGCSDGGREALMEAQRYPADFDGIIAGDPANHWTHLMTAAVANVQALNAAPASAIPPAKLKALQAAALKACGDEDSIIEDPLTCRFDPASAVCAAEVDTCLSEAQAIAARKIYSATRDPRSGGQVLSGYSPGGEAEGGGWAPWITGRAGAGQGSLMERFGRSFFASIVYADPNLDVLKLDLSDGLRRADAQYARIFNSSSPDLSAFRRRGGKLIQYHGWADPAIPALDSIDYFRAVQARMGDTADFYRLFMAPGMLHCGGGRGPNALNGPALAALAAWVEHGAAPEILVISQNLENDPSRPLLRTRPLCAFPKVAVWNGRDDRSRAESWACQAPAKRS